MNNDFASNLSHIEIFMFRAEHIYYEPTYKQSKTEKLNVIEWMIAMISISSLF